MNRLEIKGHSPQKHLEEPRGKKLNKPHFKCLVHTCHNKMKKSLIIRSQQKWSTTMRNLASIQPFNLKIINLNTIVTTTRIEKILIPLYTIWISAKASWISSIKSKWKAHRLMIKVQICLPEIQWQSNQWFYNHKLIVKEWEWWRSLVKIEMRKYKSATWYLQKGVVRLNRSTKI